MIKRITHGAAAVVVTLLINQIGIDFNQQQWHLGYLDIASASQISKGRATVVAVIDSGVEPHRDIASSLLAGTSFLSSDNNSNGQEDAQGHGTAIAGLIAATGGLEGVSGIAPESKILPVRVLDSAGAGETKNTAKAVRWATANGAQIINISNSGGPNAEVREAVEEAIAAGVIVVASAGNKPAQSIVAFPAYIDGVVAVGATDESGQVADVSVTGEKLSLTAPGVDLLSTWKNQGYRKGTGTSGSAAIVSGVAALVWSRYPELSAVEVVHRMTATAVDKGAPGRDPEYGFGIVDPVAALTANVPPLASSAGPSSSTDQGGGARSEREPETTGQAAVILAAAIASLLGTALVIALWTHRGRGRQGPG